jgi:hypothetical protein
MVTKSEMIKLIVFSAKMAGKILVFIVTMQIKLLTFMSNSAHSMTKDNLDNGWLGKK